MPVITNIIPKSGIKRAFPEKIAIEAINAPREREPVSPIKTLAFETLYFKKPKHPPSKEKDKRTSGIISSLFKNDEGIIFICNKIKVESIEKAEILVVVARPSNPSVKFTQLVVATNIKATNVIVNTPKEIDFVLNGRLKSKYPFT